MQWQVQYEEYLSEVRGMGGTPIPPISCVQVSLRYKGLFHYTAGILYNAFFNHYTL